MTITIIGEGTETSSFSLSDTFVSESVSGTATGAVSLGGGGDSLTLDSGSAFGAEFERNRTTDDVSFVFPNVTLSVTTGATPYDATVSLLDDASRGLSASGPNQYDIGAGDSPDMLLAYNLLLDLTVTGPTGSFPYSELVSDDDNLNSVVFGGMLSTTASGALSTVDFLVAGPIAFNESYTLVDPEVVATVAGTITLQNLTASATVFLLPASAWLMASGLVGLIGIARRKAIS